MATKRFKSKVDLWILLVIIALVVLDAIFIAAIAMHPAGPAETTGLILTCIALMAFIIWLSVGTHYTVDKRELRVVSGPFRWKINIDEITAVVPTRNPLSSPAMSLDRLRIEYGKRRRIMISPADKEGFLRAIGHGDV